MAKRAKSKSKRVVKVKRWTKDPAKVMGVLLGVAMLVGVVFAAVSRNSSTDVRIAAKSGCNIISTQDGPGCWCADGGWQWHCGGDSCNSAQEQSCAAENGTFKPVEQQPQANTTQTGTTQSSKCKAGEWSCGNHCADSATQRIFNSTWKNGEAQWMLEAGCGGAGGGGKQTTAPATVKPSSELCSTSSPTSLGCQGKSVGTVVGLSGGQSCTCAFTSKPACACVLSAKSRQKTTWNKITEVFTQLKESGKVTGLWTNDGIGSVSNLPTPTQKPLGSRTGDWSAITGGGVPTTVPANPKTTQKPAPTSDWTVDSNSGQTDPSNPQVDEGASKKCTNLWIASSKSRACNGKSVGEACAYTSNTKWWWPRDKERHGGTCQLSGSECSCD